MTAELDHHILQLHHEVMSGKIQTGQKPLTKHDGEKKRGTNAKIKEDRMRKKKNQNTQNKTKPK